MKSHLAAAIAAALLVTELPELARGQGFT